MNLRRNIFWLLDFFKGNSLKKTYHFTIAILEAKDRRWVKTENAKKLDELLSHATQTTQYYKDKAFKTLEDFPVVDKNMIRNHYDEFFSDKYDKKDCKLVATSGSTGSPFRLYQNKEKVRKIQSDNLYFSAKSNFKLGQYLVFIRIWPKSLSTKLKLNFWIKNFKPWNILNLSDAAIAKLITELNQKNKTISFLGYPTALEKICNYIAALGENPIRFKTQSIITISEALKPTTKAQVEQYFGVTPLSRYSNNETGIIAQQIEGNTNKFRINDSSYVIEILNLNEDTVVPFGQPGRIVLTDLYNKATLLIRYDTGDIGCMDLDENGIPYFTEISGRKIDQLYNTKGDLISSHLSLRVLDYGSFKQYQLVQKSKKEYHFNFNTDAPVAEAKLIADYKTYFGDDAIIKINYVDEVPLLASGKRREVVNEFYL
ncbi:phenylacetate--CoA ligase family protein [Winogradskyella vidalii]|uniref:CoF synthetase n=1 Tax=Winogradskyella vidalii TaxID=2615024 RepID=UPI0015CDF729|nr:CoF synthetase [Winogradskyella vidalii]